MLWIIDFSFSSLDFIPFHKSSFFYWTLFLLLQADVNVYNTEGLSAFHILMVQLMDLAAYESLPISSRGNNPMTDDMIVESMSK